MNVFKTISSGLLAGLCLAGTGTVLPSRAALAPDHARLGTDVATVIRNFQVTDASPLSVGPDASGFFTAALAAELPERIQVDALCVDGPLILFSTDLDVELGGTVFADDDLIAFDPRHGMFSKRFDGRLHGIPARADLDAATLDRIWGRRPAAVV